MDNSPQAGHFYIQEMHEGHYLYFEPNNKKQ